VKNYAIAKFWAIKFVESIFIFNEAALKLNKITS